MKEKALGLLGLMRRANAIALGEENTGAAVKAGKASLLLLARDASENARLRAEHFARGRRVLQVPLPFTKEELAASTGVAGGSMAAVTDLGFAKALMELLAAQWPEEYGELSAETARRWEKRTRRAGVKKTNGRRRTKHEHD